jgi:hypothetical protein
LSSGTPGNFYVYPLKGQKSCFIEKPSIFVKIFSV